VEALLESTPANKERTMDRTEGKQPKEEARAGDSPNYTIAQRISHFRDFHVDVYIYRYMYVHVYLYTRINVGTGTYIYTYKYMYTYTYILI